MNQYLVPGLGFGQGAQVLSKFLMQSSSWTLGHCPPYPGGRWTDSLLGGTEVSETENTKHRKRQEYGLKPREQETCMLDAEVQLLSLYPSRILSPSFHPLQAGDWKLLLWGHAPS